MMADFPPLRSTWDGEAFYPRHPRVADRHLVVGQEYCLVEHHERSIKSHRHYFAAISETWKNLSDEQTERWPSPEHLRKYALIKAGYRDERSIVCASKAEAQRVAAFVKPMDNYAVVAVREAVVIVYTAASQSTKAMGRKEFARSKDAVLKTLSDLIGTTPEALTENARTAA